MCHHPTARRRLKAQETQVGYADRLSCLPQPLTIGIGKEITFHTKIPARTLSEEHFGPWALCNSPIFALVLGSPFVPLELFLARAF